MTDAPEILVTNDDGIDAPGIRALADGLDDVGNVTVVAPTNDRSATGRAMSQEVAVEEHELGYSIDGTPADCVVAGLEALGPYPDVVVAGINDGANLGMYVLGRSGTVSAAVEAAFFGVPAIASSLYLSQEDFGTALDPEDFDAAVDATCYLVEHALDAGVFEHADYLNVNAPQPKAAHPDEMAVTRPSHGYDMTASRDGETITLHDRMWDRMEEGNIPDPPGTDRRAVVNGHVSVSPLTAPHTTEHHEALDALAETY
jgi:5'-nucleotidase